MIDKISVHNNDRFDEIVQDIKTRNLSKNYSPKIVVGTGLSVPLGVPGMSALENQLRTKFRSHYDRTMREAWEKVEKSVRDNGLENGLSSLNDGDSLFIDEIKRFTAEYILTEERKLQDVIYQKDSGFFKLLKYLKASWSVNNTILDIMTPNYDRIIEIICDRLRIPVITGFSGEIFQTFNEEILKNIQPGKMRSNGMHVRLFKPHGSLNWISNENDIILTNDHTRLMDNIENIEIITPGSSKYKAGMTVNIFREMRETFHDVLERARNYSLLIYGYGFNDPQFDTVLDNIMELDNGVDVLIISLAVKEEKLDLAMKNQKITIFYEDKTTNQPRMIYKRKQYELDAKLWDMDIFSEIFL